MSMKHPLTPSGIEPAIFLKNRVLSHNSSEASWCGD